MFQGKSQILSLELEQLDKNETEISQGAGRKGGRHFGCRGKAFFWIVIKQLGHVILEAVVLFVVVTIG